MNFNIRLDGCAKVNFKNFEKIIDKLGGLDLTLTAGEAKYLNNTNYISNPDNRTVVEGTQHMNGNQVLGYARVRKRATITGNNNDYGRTDRHRIVLNAIFEKYKSKSKVELASLMFNILPMITTDIDQKTFEMLLNTFIEMGTTEIQQLRIPANGTFTDNIKVRGMDVLIPELDENIDILHKFIFGEDTTAASTDESTTEGTDGSAAVTSDSSTQDSSTDSVPAN
jgi:anionic cell wall polymer biosynthesis LytR-Cps2A-Psr (LCP) family protein